MYKLGKHPPKLDSRTLRFGKYLKPELLRPPRQVTCYRKVGEAWTMMANDRFHDCTCAAAGHMVQEWNDVAQNRKVIISDHKILIAYQAINGHFDPKTGSDRHPGCSMLDVLKYWRKTGIGGHKVTAFAQMKLKNRTEVMAAIDLFGGCYIGVALPNFVVPHAENEEKIEEIKHWNKIAWEVPASGPVESNARPNQQNGHCIPAFGYDDKHLQVVTWGKRKPMSWDFYEAYTEEAYAVLSEEWLHKDESPPGFDLAALEADLKAVRSA